MNPPNHLQDSGATPWNYFVVMIDHGRKGREAVVDPELTRRNILERVQSREYEPDRIIFIHEICDGTVTNIKDDIFAEADALNYAHALSSSLDFVQDAIDRQWDHRRDGLKHERV